MPEEPESPEVSEEIDSEDIDEESSDEEQIEPIDIRKNQSTEELNLFDDEE